MDKYLLIKQQDVNALIEYLATKPYKEVAQAIAVLSSLPNCKDFIGADDKHSSNLCSHGSDR